MSSALDPSCKSLQILHKKYIKGTLSKAIVQDRSMFLCNLTRSVMSGAQVVTSKVYIKTRVVKHLYDKRPAAWYSFILEHLTALIKYPDEIYLNKSGKRGSFGFCKKFEEILLYASLEKVLIEDQTEEIYVVTTFETDEDYLKGCTLIWSWRGGNPSS